jgi:Ribonuclease G/E
MKPIVMYENNVFVKEVFKDKYYRIISECLIENKCTWEDVVKIRKVEERYERS